MRVDRKPGSFKAFIHNFIIIDYDLVGCQEFEIMQPSYLSDLVQVVIIVFSVDVQEFDDGREVFT